MKKPFLIKFCAPLPKGTSEVIRYHKDLEEASVRGRSWCRANGYSFKEAVAYTQKDAEAASIDLGKSTLKEMLATGTVWGYINELGMPIPMTDYKYLELVCCLGGLKLLTANTL